MKKITLILFTIFLFLGCGGSSGSSTTNSVTVEAITVTELSNKLSESSGLVNVNSELWTHNDSGSKARLYSIDLSNGKILKTVKVSKASNVDWEDLAVNDTHLFVGDFGNNEGKRKDLKIYKISLEDLKTKTEVDAEIIEFSYATQTEFTKDTNTNYDCEAFVVYENKLYLFSKNHGDEKTDMYVLTIEAGTQVAEKLATYNTNALVTGASMDVDNKILVLIGHANKGTPKTWIFSEFTEADFFNGKEKIFSWVTPEKAQIEGVTHKEKGKLYISSEKSTYSNDNLDQALYELNY